MMANIAVQLEASFKSKAIKPPKTASMATRGIIALIPSAAPRFEESVESVSHALKAASLADEPKLNLCDLSKKCFVGELSLNGDIRGINGCLAMAVAALFVVASALDVRCGSCFHAVWNQEREKAGLSLPMTEDTSGAIKVGIEAMKLLIQNDKK